MSDPAPIEPSGLFYRKGPSMMRLGYFVGLILTVLLVGAGVYVVICLDAAKAAQGVALAASGTALYTAGSFAKSWQAQAENKGE